MTKNLDRLIKSSNQKGISLVEITVAMAIMGIMTFAIVDLMSTMKAMTLDMNAKIGMTELRGEILQITNNPGMCFSQLVNPNLPIQFAPGTTPSPAFAPPIIPFPIRFSAPPAPPIIFGDGGDLAPYDLFTVRLELSNVVNAAIYQGPLGVPLALCTRPPCAFCYCVGGICANTRCAMQAQLNLRAAKRPGALGGTVLQTRTIGNLIFEVSAGGATSQVTNCWTSGLAPLPACAANQILSSNGSGYICLTIPTCAAGQKLTFDGTLWTCDW